MSLVVFWLDEPEINYPHGKPNMRMFGDDVIDKLGEALRFTEVLRNAGCRHINISGENPNMVGKQGVDSVRNGATPDGVPYTWKKRRP